MIVLRLNPLEIDDNPLEDMVNKGLLDLDK